MIQFLNVASVWLFEINLFWLYLVDWYEHWWIKNPLITRIKSVFWSKIQPDNYCTPPISSCSYTVHYAPWMQSDRNYRCILRSILNSVLMYIQHILTLQDSLPVLPVLCILSVLSCNSISDYNKCNFFLFCMDFNQSLWESSASVSQSTQPIDLISWQILTELWTKSPSGRVPTFLSIFSKIK